MMMGPRWVQILCEELISPICLLLTAPFKRIEAIFAEI